MEESETTSQGLHAFFNLPDDWHLSGLPIDPSASASFSLQYNPQADEAPDESHDLFHGDFPDDIDEGLHRTPTHIDARCSRASQEPTSRRSDSLQGGTKPRRKKFTRMPKIPGGYPCVDCEELGESRAFDTDAELRKHRQQVHTPPCDRPLGCAFCSKRFHYQKDLTRHLKTHSEYDRPTAPQQTTSMSQITLPVDSQPASQECVSSASQTFLGTDDVDQPSAKRRRREALSSGKHQKVPTAVSSESSDFPEQEATYTENHRHHSRKAFFSTANRELRTFVDMQASEITITATIDKCTETFKIVARHEVHALHEKHSDSDLRTTPTPSRPKRARERIRTRSDRGSSNEVLA